MSRKKEYRKKLKKSELISKQAKEEASQVLEDLETIYEKTDKTGLLDKKNSITNKINDLNNGTISD